jgi:hypothetical protein
MLGLWILLNFVKWVLAGFEENTFNFYTPDATLFLIILAFETRLKFI